MNSIFPSPTLDDLPGRDFSRRGFSLVEVMVSILILGVALVALTQGIGAALSATKESENQTIGALLAQEQMETLRAQTDWTDGETEGDFGDDQSVYRWKQTITQADIEGLHEVSVVVEKSSTGLSVYELKTLLFQIPSEGPSATTASPKKLKKRGAL